MTATRRGSKLRLVLGLMVALLAGAAGLLPVAAGPFDLGVEYVADGKFGSGDKARDGRLWRTRYALRQETPQGRGVQIIIARLDRNLAWILVPGVKVALETDLAALDLPLGALTDGRGLRQSPRGSETIAGVATTRYWVETVDGPGAPPGAAFAGDVWTSPDGVLMKIDGRSNYKGRASTVRASFHNIRVGPQDPALFQLPQGYNRMQVPAEDLQAMIESFQRFRLPR